MIQNRININKRRIDDFKEYINKLFQKNSDEVNFSYEKDIETFFNKNHNKAVKSNLSISNYFVVKNNTLLVQNINFNSSESILICQKLLDNRCGLFEEIGFKNCIFNCDIERIISKLEISVFFYDCTFRQKIQILCDASNKHLCFIKCDFFGLSEFGSNMHKNMPYVLDISDCYFRSGSITKIVNITEKGDMAENIINIRDTIINGNLMFSNISKESETILYLKNVAFLKSIIIYKSSFHKISKFQNISLPQNSDMSLILEK